jgi:hypothetical protein
MKTTKIIRGWMMIILAISISACEYTYVEPIQIIIDDDVPVSFAEKLEPAFAAKCASCHASMAPILTSGNIYNSLVGGGYLNTADPEASEIYLKIQAGHPSANSTFNATEIAYLLKWIEQGAANN